MTCRHPVNTFFVSFLQASSRSGTPDELKALVDKPQRLNLVVLIDSVPQKPKIVHQKPTKPLFCCFLQASSRFGTPDELKALVYEAHTLGLVVLIDIVHRQPKIMHQKCVKKLSTCPFVVSCRPAAGSALQMS